MDKQAPTLRWISRITLPTMPQHSICHLLQCFAEDLDTSAEVDWLGRNFQVASIGTGQSCINSSMNEIRPESIETSDTESVFQFSQRASA